MIENYFSTGLPAQTAPKQKSHTTKSSLMQDWVLRLGRNLQSAVKKGTKTSVIKMVYLKRTINLLHNDHTSKNWIKYTQKENTSIKL